MHVEVVKRFDDVGGSRQLSECTYYLGYAKIIFPSNAKIKVCHLNYNRSLSINLNWFNVPMYHVPKQNVKARGTLVIY